MRDWPTFAPSLLWMLEFQRRGAPHFHLVIFWRREPHKRQVRRWVADTWNRIAEPGDETARRVGTSADPIDTSGDGGEQRLIRYLAKYLCKKEQKLPVDPETGDARPTGRMWGLIGDVPLAEYGTVQVDERTYVQLCRRIRRWGRRSRYLSQVGKRYPGALIFVKAASFLSLLRGLSLDEQPRGP